MISGGQEDPIQSLKKAATAFPYNIPAHHVDEVVGIFLKQGEKLCDAYYGTTVVPEGVASGIVSTQNAEQHKTCLDFFGKDGEIRREEEISGFTGAERISEVLKNLGSDDNTALSITSLFYGERVHSPAAWFHLAKKALLKAEKSKQPEKFNVGGNVHVGLGGGTDSQSDLGGAIEWSYQISRKFQIMGRGAAGYKTGILLPDPIPLSATAEKTPANIPTFPRVGDSTNMVMAGNELSTGVKYAVSGTTKKASPIPVDGPLNRVQSDVEQKILDAYGDGSAIKDENGEATDEKKIDAGNIYIKYVLRPILGRATDYTQFNKYWNAVMQVGPGLVNKLFAGNLTEDDAEALFQTFQMAPGTFFRLLAIKYGKDFQDVTLLEDDVDFEALHMRGSREGEVTQAVIQEQFKKAIAAQSKLGTALTVDELVKKGWNSDSADPAAAPVPTERNLLFSYKTEIAHKMKLIMEALEMEESEFKAAVGKLSTDKEPIKNLLKEETIPYNPWAGQKLLKELAEKLAEEYPERAVFAMSLEGGIFDRNYSYSGGGFKAKLEFAPLESLGMGAALYIILADNLGVTGGDHNNDTGFGTGANGMALGGAFDLKYDIFNALNSPHTNWMTALELSALGYINGVGSKVKPGKGATQIGGNVSAVWGFWRNPNGHARLTLGGVLGGRYDMTKEPVPVNTPETGSKRLMQASLKWNPEELAAWLKKTSVTLAYTNAIGPPGSNKVTLEPRSTDPNPTETLEREVFIRVNQATLTLEKTIETGLVPVTLSLDSSLGLRENRVDPKGKNNTFTALDQTEFIEMLKAEVKF